MKIKLFLILLFSHYVLQSQNIEPLYHIRGHFENCNHGFLKNCYPFVTLRKGNEIIKDSLFFATDTSDYFFIDNLSKGKYTIEYYNFFNQKFDNQIDLIKNIDTLKFCDDLFEKDKEKGVIENLAEKDTFLIDYQMIACFDEDYKKVIFIKEKNKTIAKLYYSRPSKNSIKYYLKKKKKLSEKDIEAVADLEELFRHWNKDIDGGCTLSSTYKLIYKNKELCEFTDNTCCLGIIENLEFKLFGIKK